MDLSDFINKSQIKGLAGGKETIAINSLFTLLTIKR